MRLLLAVSLLFAATLPAQQKPTLAILGETIEVSIVNLDVIVTDRQGNRVRGLKPSDFQVRENGKLQTISNFAEYSSDAAPVSSPAAATDETRAPANAKTMVVFIERVNLHPRDADRLYASLEEVLVRVVRPGDAVSVVWWDGGMTIRQDFTDDLPLLTRTLRDLREESKKLMLPDSESLGRRQKEQDSWEEMLEGTDMPAPDVMAADSAMLARRAFMQMKAKTYALTSLIDVIAPARGKKILLMATRRYSEFAGAEFFKGAQMPQVEQREYNTLALRKSVSDSANAGGVTIYAVYPPGLPKRTAVSAEEAPNINRAGSTRDEQPERDEQNSAFEWNVLLNESRALEDLARATGGLSAWGAGSIVEMLPTLGDDMQSYYSLAFRATPGKRKERRIEVRAVNGQYQVRARQSYVEKTEAERMADRVVAHLFRPEGANALAVSAEIGEAMSRGAKVAIPVKIRIPIGDLTILPEGAHHSGAFTVFAAAGGGVGVVSGVTQTTQPFQIPSSDLERARASHYSYELTVMTDGTAEHVSVGVLDELSKQYGIVRLSLY
ncbi:MAG TPA: VWA domain-containing protein [Thermoanaerobaculia bacterium]|nr:VWA domain-containing protein [Thermoanaerobaculia bacterium]